MTADQLRAAHRWLRLFLDEYEDEIIAMAVGRYALGEFLYPDRPLYAKSRAELSAEIAEELADAIVYARRRLDL